MVRVGVKITTNREMIINGNPDLGEQRRKAESSPQQKTLWVGDLEQWVDENFLIHMFPDHITEITSTKIIRDKNTMMPAGYGFLEFITHDSAKRVLEQLDGQPIKNYPQKRYRLNWASFGINEKHPEIGTSIPIFVGDLDNDITDYYLESTFRERYPSVVNARVLTDIATGRSKGYGFVRFGDEQEAKKAIIEMNGQYLLSRPIRVNEASQKKASDNVGGGAMSSTSSFLGGGQVEENENTTVFIGGIGTQITQEQLKAHFEPYGNIKGIKIPPGKGCGFVEFNQRDSAETAIESLQGSQIGGSRVRLSWGRQDSFATTYPYASMYQMYGEGAGGVSFDATSTIDYSSTMQNMIYQNPYQQQQYIYPQQQILSNPNLFNYNSSTSISSSSVSSFAQPFDVEKDNKEFIKRHIKIFHPPMPPPPSSLIHQEEI